MGKTQTKSAVLLEHPLKALKLPTISAEAEKIACRCAADNADRLAFLLQFVERERKAAERRLKAARLRATKILDEFDFAARPRVNKPQILELVKGEYLGRRENILFVGPSGTGKTHLATALGMAAWIVTTNLRFENWTEVPGNERLTGAALDRLTHRCHILETKGENWRLQDPRRRRRPD